MHQSFFLKSFVKMKSFVRAGVIHIRVSSHFYNTREDIDLFIEKLSEYPA